jgi:hypothetical protein
MKTKYRIVSDRYAGYECQIWRWYWPFWVQMGFTNTHLSIEAAKRYIDSHAFVVNYKPNEK